MALNWKEIGKYGLITGVAILYVCLVGMVEAFDKRDIVAGVLSLGKALLVVISLGLGYVTAWKLNGGNAGRAILSSLIVGLIGSLMTALLIVAIETVNLRAMFVNASSALVRILTFGQESEITGLLMLSGGLIFLSILGAGIYLLPRLLRWAVVAGLMAVLFLGMLTELLTVILARFEITEWLADIVFVGRRGLSTEGTIYVFLIFAGLNALWTTQRGAVQKVVSKRPPAQQRLLKWGLIILAVGILFYLPAVVGPYISQILVLVGLYALMGLGLNIEIGLAGLLDLGFVGFFAIGAYTVALMNTTGALGLSTVTAGEAISESYASFWVAVPIAILVSAIAGVFLGIPVLRMRGDYLAIVTLGFAEIIRILVLSDFLRPFIGGAQGILNIPKPNIAPLQSLAESLPSWLQTPLFFFMSRDGFIKDPGHFYYLIIIGCVVIGFIAWRLQNARVGRNWMAMREDEDVAEAMGINLISSKLLAFGIGAAFAGLSGAIFAAQVGSVFPHSFGLIVSINVVSLVIIGGSGSIPGVILGALVLVGMPELLREFAEFRLLIYGALLVVMMLVRPEGLWPSEVSRRELHRDEPDAVPAAGSKTVQQAA